MIKFEKNTAFLWSFHNNSLKEHCEVIGSLLNEYCKNETERWYNNASQFFCLRATALLRGVD